MLMIFIELSGLTARAELEHLAQRFKQDPTCQNTQILASLEQADLYLLVAEFNKAPQIHWPDKARVWSFRRL